MHQSHVKALVPLCPCRQHTMSFFTGLAPRNGTLVSPNSREIREASIVETLKPWWKEVKSHMCDTALLCLSQFHYRNTMSTTISSTSRPGYNYPCFCTPMGQPTLRLVTKSLRPFFGLRGGPYQASDGINSDYNSGWLPQAVMLSLTIVLYTLDCG